MAKRYFIVTVDGKEVTVNKSAKKPVFDPVESYGGVRACFYDGTHGECVSFASGFLQTALGLIRVRDL